MGLEGTPNCKSAIGTIHIGNVPSYDQFASRYPNHNQSYKVCLTALFGFWGTPNPGDKSLGYDVYRPPADLFDTCLRVNRSSCLEKLKLCTNIPSSPERGRSGHVDRSTCFEKLKLYINIPTLPERGRSGLRRSKLLLRISFIKLLLKHHS